MGKARILSLTLTFACALASTALAQSKPPTTWRPASSSNYTTINYSRGITFVVIHDIEGSASGGISWFQNPAAQASAHYVVSYAGAITQMVEDKNIAWHAGNSYYNLHSIGIEHEGFANRNNWTDAEYRASASLTRWICLTYGIPMDRSHIIGHNEVPDPDGTGYGGASNHTDPGPYFNWTYYMSLVRQSSSPAPTPPPATSMQKAMQVSVDALNVRSGTSTGNSIIGGIYSGQRYVAVASSGGWYKIHYANNTGWCSGSYLTGISGVTGVLINTVSLNVRTGPSTGYSIVGTTSSGQKYVRSASSGGWYQIYWGGAARWVSGAYTSTFGL
ncbi:MAG: N-acetylmuramoyl-L-alanine amidase [Planctomycetes bacterium]|nr:N-acetylmuramoyl-L-alanine amidase [Planctomycetota bacterium]